MIGSQVAFWGYIKQWNISLVTKNKAFLKIINSTKYKTTKAAVLKQLSCTPVYSDFPDPYHKVKKKFTVIPDSIDLALAAALPNAIMISAMALHARAKIKPGVID